MREWAVGRRARPVLDVGSLGLLQFASATRVAVAARDGALAAFGEALAGCWSFVFRSFRY